MNATAAAFGLALGCVLVAPGSAGSTAVAQSTSIVLGVPDGREFLVRLPAQARPCQIHAYQTGSFGGYGLLRERALGDGVYAIRTGLRGLPARTLKIAVACRGWKVALIDVPDLPSSTWEAAPTMTSLGEITLIGRVLPPADGTDLTGVEVRVSHTPYWLCGFFGLLDCLLPILPVATARIGDDWTFQIALPDLMKDPVVFASLYDSGFRYSLETADASVQYELVRAGFPAPGEIVFRPRRR